MAMPSAAKTWKRARKTRGGVDKGGGAVGWGGEACCVWRCLKGEGPPEKSGPRKCSDAWLRGQPRVSVGQRNGLGKLALLR